MKIESLANNQAESSRQHVFESALQAAKAESLRSQKQLSDSNNLIITNIKQGVKNSNRANIFVNGKYSFSLDITQLVDFKLKIGMVITEDDLATYKNASEFGKLYQRTLEWVLTRPHSTRETRDYLHRKIYDKKLDPAFEARIIERLLSKNYLNDEAFTRWYVDNRFVKKGISARRLSLELAKKGISKDIIADVLETSERDEAAEARKIIARKRSRYDDEQLISYLCRQGFSYQLARSLVLDSETD